MNKRGKNRPDKDYTYIYIYKNTNKILYVGQTKQSLYNRYKQHIYTNSAGAENATDIYYFQIESIYADYIEGYISSKLDAENLITFPNYKKYKYETPDKYTINQINNIIEILSTHKSLPVRIGRMLNPLQVINTIGFTNK